MHISANSGHHRASLAIEKALNSIDPDIDILNINAFNYTNPILEKVINKTYMGIVRSKPEVWDYLYDNPAIFQRVQRLRDLIHNMNSEKLQGLINSFQPDVIACTQAFPCGMIADLKKRGLIDAKLFGVLTDYNAHSYWIYDTVDYYITAAEHSVQRLLQSGVQQDRIKPFGIPIDPKFSRKIDEARIRKQYNLRSGVPTLLIMGGGQGLGPIRHMVKALESMEIDFQIMVVAGTNKRLYRWLSKRAMRVQKKQMVVFDYIDNIEELMHVSDVIITKAGGLTTFEALSKGLPIIIVAPLPGQEAKNTQFLTDIDAAVMVKTHLGLPQELENLLSSSDRLDRMRQAARSVGKPASAMDAARLIVETN